MPSVQKSIAIIYASTTGNTEFVVDTVCERLSKSQDVRITMRQRAEQTKPEDLLKADVLILASGSWNTGGIEGQLNPHMYALAHDRAKALDLKKKPSAVIGLGDERYYYTARAADHLNEFVLSHNGKVLLPQLMIVNEPYEQVEKIHHWTDELLSHIEKLPVSLVAE